MKSQGIKKLKVESLSIPKKQTKSQTKIIFFDTDQKNEFDQIPSPVQSSEQASEHSLEAKYLSYIVKVLDYSPANSDSISYQIHANISEYFNIIYECAIYVKKQYLRTEIDDELIFEEFSTYFNLDKLHPVPKNDVAKQLLQNGYFLVAYSLVIGRRKKSQFLIKFLINYFKASFKIQSNKEQFQYFSQNFLDEDHMQNIAQQTPTGDENIRFNYNIQYPKPQSQIIKRSYLQMNQQLDKQKSDYSKTIRLDSEGSFQMFDN